MSDERDESETGFSEDQAPLREATRTRLEAAAIELQERRKIAESLRTDDLDIAQRVKALGFDEETAIVIDLVPLVHVAWADGEVQRKERAAIMRVLDARGIAPGAPAWVLMESLLEQEPPPAYLDETLAVFRDLIAGNTRRIDAMVDLCVAVAEAAGGFLGFGNRVDESERERLEHIAAAFGNRGITWLGAKMGDGDA